MIIGYTKSEKGASILKHFGCDAVYIEEKNFKSSVLNEVISKITKNDVLVVEDLILLGDVIDEIIGIWVELIEREVEVVVLNQYYLDTRNFGKHTKEDNLKMVTDLLGWMQYKKEVKRKERMEKSKAKVRKKITGRKKVYTLDNPKVKEAIAMYLAYEYKESKNGKRRKIKKYTKTFIL